MWNIDNQEFVEYLRGSGLYDYYNGTNALEKADLYNKFLVSKAAIAGKSPSNIIFLRQ
jgi:hypothetical protein